MLLLGKQEEGARVPLGGGAEISCLPDWPGFGCGALPLDSGGCIV